LRKEAFEDEKTTNEWFQVSHDFNILGSEHKEYIEKAKREAD
jgi:hypothetical protein